MIYNVLCLFFFYSSSVTTCFLLPAGPGAHGRVPEPDLIGAAVPSLIICFTDFSLWFPSCSIVETHNKTLLPPISSRWRRWKRKRSQILPFLFGCNVASHILSQAEGLFLPGYSVLFCFVFLSMGLAFFHEPQNNSMTNSYWYWSDSAAS